MTERMEIDALSKIKIGVERKEREKRGQTVLQTV